MISDGEKNVLQETCKNTGMALGAIDTILNKVYNQELAYELNCQSNRYRELKQKAEAALRREGIEPKESSGMQRAMLWSSVQANTLLNTSSSHVADLMIRGNAKGIAELMKATHNNKVKNSYVNEIANELMDFEEKNIEKLKSYL